MNEKQLKEKLIKVGHMLVENNLVEGSGGNISARLPGKEWLFITPSGMPYKEIEIEDIVKLNLNGDIKEGKRKPSIEYRMHSWIYKNHPKINGVAHVHSFYAKVVATARKEIPPILDSVALTFEGSIELAEYARPGSQEMAENVNEKLEKKQGTLIANHGSIGIGENLEAALNVCEVIEEAAKIMIYASSIGGAVTLSEEAIKNDIEFFKVKKGYGQN